MKELLIEIQRSEIGKNRDKKSRFFVFGLALIIFLSITGLLLFFTEDLETFDMFILLAHSGLGFLFFIPCIMMYKRHAKYQHLMSHRGYWYLGYALNTLMWLTLLSGIYVFFFGVTGERIMWWAHIVVSVSVTVFLATYIFFALRFISRGMHPKHVHKFYKVVYQSIAIFGFALLSLFLASFVASEDYEVFDPVKIEKGYKTSLVNIEEGKVDQFPSYQVNAEGKFYKLETLTRSKSCGTSGCHEGILEEWNESAHYMSPSIFVDRVRALLIEEGKKGELFKDMGTAHMKMFAKTDPGRQVFRRCAACHSPVALATGGVSSHKAPSQFAEYEGNSCVLCHSIHNQYANNIGGGDYTLKAPRRYLFAFSDHPLAEYINNKLISLKPEFHKKTFMKPDYKSPTYCAPCHNRIQFTLWAKGPYNSASHTESKTCHDCHMPHVELDNEISAKVNGSVRSHRFIAAGLNRAKYYNLETQYKKTVEFMKDEKIKLTVVSPFIAERGKSAEFVVRIANVGVGHDFPAGPEGDMAQAWVELDVKDESGRVLFQYGKLDKDGYLDMEKHHVYRVISLDDWNEEVGPYKHRSWWFSGDILVAIPPKMYDEHKFQFHVPKTSKSVTIKAKFNYRRPNQKFIDFALGKGVYRTPMVAMSEDMTEIKIVDKFEDPEKERIVWAQRLASGEGTLKLEKMSGPPKREFKPVSLLNQVLYAQIEMMYEKGQVDDAIKVLSQVAPRMRKARVYRELYKKLHDAKNKREAASVKEDEPQPKDR